MSGAALRFIVSEIERTPEPLCPDPFIAGLEREAESGRRWRCPANDSRSSRGLCSPMAAPEDLMVRAGADPWTRSRDRQDEPNPDQLRR